MPRNAVRSRSQLVENVERWRKRALRAESRERKLQTRIEHLVAANERLSRELRERSTR